MLLPLLRGFKLRINILHAVRFNLGNGVSDPAALKVDTSSTGDSERWRGRSPVSVQRSLVCMIHRSIEASSSSSAIFVLWDTYIDEAPGHEAPPAGRFCLSRAQNRRTSNTDYKPWIRHVLWVCHLSVGVGTGHDISAAAWTWAASTK